MSSPASSDQTLRICEHLLLSSPPGQFDLILRDLHNILSNTSNTTALTPEWIATVRQSHHQRTHDPRSSNNNTSSTTTDDFQTALTTALKSYRHDTGTTGGPGNGNPIVTSTHLLTPPTDDGDTSYSLTLYTERLALPNYNAGSWSSQWTIDPTQGTISGNINVHAHCFENGNVQLQVRREFTATDVRTADQVVEKLREWDEEIVAELEGMYGNMSDGMLKSMRRVLPISKVRMDWNVNVHRFVKTLGEVAEATKD